MNFHQPGLEDLRERLVKLEQQNNRMKQLGAVVLAVLAAVVVMGQAPAKKTLEANEFVLKDDAGNTRARLFVTAKSIANMTIPGMSEPVPMTSNPKASLALYDEKGQVTGVLDDDSMTFFKSQVSLGGGALTIGDQTAGVLISRYSVSLLDEQGFQATLGRTSLATPRTGETHLTSAASLILFDKGKNVIWKAP